MKKSIIYSAVGVVIAGYAALSAYVIINQPIEPLLICADSGGLKVPFSRSICRAYLFNFRGTEQDIANLEQGIGASFIVQGESNSLEREQILKYLLSRSLDINNIGMHQLTALHDAVLANSTEEVEMLLHNGADTKIRDKKYGLTPLELAVKLQDSDGLRVDRKPVIVLLENFNRR